MKALYKLLLNTLLVLVCLRCFDAVCYFLTLPLSYCGILVCVVIALRHMTHPQHPPREPQPVLDLERTNTRNRPQKKVKKRRQYRKCRTKLNRPRVTYELEENWLQSLRCSQWLYVFDKDTNSWEIGRVIEKSERRYETHSKYVMKVQYQHKISDDDVRKYFIWVTVNQSATASWKIAKIKRRKRATIPVYHRSEPLYHLTRTLICDGCKRKCCHVCFTVQVTRNQYLCHDCVGTATYKKLYLYRDIIASDFDSKQKKITNYFDEYNDRKRRLSWEIECTFCKQEHGYRKGLYMFGLCASCQALTKTLMQIRWISDLITGEIVEALCVYFEGYLAPCTNYTKCQKEVYISSAQLRSSSPYFFRLNFGGDAYAMDEEDMELNAVDQSHVCKMMDLYTRVTCLDCKQDATVNHKCQLERCRNIDYQFNPCLRHPMCDICNKRSVVTFHCANCKKRYCNICGIRTQSHHKWKQYREIRDDCHYEWCINCIVKSEYDRTDNAVLAGIESNDSLSVYNRFDVNIYCIISGYSYGFAVQCMASQCDKEIVIHNKYEFVRKLKHLYYTLRGKSNGRKTVLLYGKKHRMFCEECIANGKVEQCQVPYCTNRDESDACAMHKFCELCCKVVLPSRRQNKNKCVHCLKRVCDHCYVFGGLGFDLCNRCVWSRILGLWLEPYITDEPIIHVLMEYAPIFIPYEDAYAELCIVRRMKPCHWIRMKLCHWFRSVHWRHEEYYHWGAEDTNTVNCDPYESAHHYFDESANLWENKRIKKKFNEKCKWKMTAKQAKTKKRIKKSKSKHKREHLKRYIKRKDYL